MSLRIVTLAFLVVVAPDAHGQVAPASPWTTEVIVSRTLDQRRPVFIVTPEGYDTSSLQYPVLVLLDANDRPQFELAITNIAFLASRHAILPLIIVGIPNVGHRTHDLTPAASGETARDLPMAGGAAAFESFIIDEVLPKVRAKYRTLPSTTILAGHSFGGLFALNVAATRPGIFAGIIAMSPAMWWNDSDVIDAYAEAIAKSRAPQRIFLTSGGLEPDIDRTTRRFARRLESLSRPPVMSAYRGYPDDTHTMTPAQSLVDGLRFVFGPMPGARVQSTLDSDR